MLPLLLLLLYCWSHAGASPEFSHTAAQEPAEAVQADSKPYIHHCRSPNMETFTCWWRPLDNNLQGDDNITYRLVYTLGNGPPTECPDYVSGGANSCYFDIKHTVIWEVYCLNVTAYSSSGSFTSNEHCLDVADIVEVDPPINLTYTLNMTMDEAGCTVLVSWQYPIAQHVQIGWITLIYELRYRPVSKPSTWKVKGQLREPHLELFGLPVGRYEIQVRCRSKNSHLWSQWSSPITIVVIPSINLPDQILYVLVLMTTIVVIILLTIGFGIVPQGKRMKAFLLPPIPKPCIRGIDPMLLKKGQMDEINRHFASLQGYKAPHYCRVSVYHVSMDESVLLSRLSSMSSLQKDKEPQSLQCPDSTEDQQLLYTPDIPSPHGQNSSNCCTESSEPTVTPETTLWARPEKSHTQPQLLAFPGTAYSMIVNTAPANTIVPPNPQEFYTCVHGVTANEMVELVPCMSDSLKASTYFELKDKPEEDTEKLTQLAAFLEKRVEVQANEMRFYPVEAEHNAYVVPLLPQSAGERRCVN